MVVFRSSSWDDVVRSVEPVPVLGHEGGRMVVSLCGEHDMSTAASVAEALAIARAVGAGDLVVDLSGVLFMDSTIVTALVRGRDALRSQSRDLTVRRPSRFARRVLDLCGLLGLIDPASAAAADDGGPGAAVRGARRHSPRREPAAPSLPAVVPPPTAAPSGPIAGRG